MDNQRESGYKNDEQEWLGRARKVWRAFFTDDRINSQMAVLKKEFSDVYELSPLYHVCSGSGTQEGQPLLAEDKQAKLQEFEKNLRRLIEQVEQAEK